MKTKQIILISGFLGSGKTTFIIKLAEYLSKKNSKVALIVNEVGEIGIDNQYMKKLGYNVWEIFGGCICCSLSSSLESTIEQLEKTYDPDVIIIEPSGAAEPKFIYNSLLDYHQNKYELKNIFILDPTRLDMFLDVVYPLFISSLKLADTVVINKIDLITDESIDKCKKMVELNNKNALSFTLDFNQELQPEFKTYLNILLEGSEIDVSSRI